MSKRIVISGASSGIGFELATFFHDKGYDVTGLSRNFPKNDYKFKHLLCDVTKEDEINKTVDILKEEGIDILINCAGMGISGAVEHTSLDEVKKIFDVNVYGTFLLTKAFIPLLRDNKNSKIFNIGSVAGELSIPFQTFYSMTKASIEMFTEGLANELRPFGIQVCSVLPGDTKTPFTNNRIQPTLKSDSIYNDRIVKSIKKMEKDEQNGMPVKSVSKVINKLIYRKRIPLLVTVGFQYKLFVFLKRILPKKLVYYIIYNMYGK